MRIIQSLLSCVRKNDIVREIRQLEKTVLATKLVNADNTLSATLRSIKPVQNDTTKGLRSCLKNASVEKRLQALEPILQKNMEHYVSGFNIEDKNAIMLSYYSGKLNSCIDHHAERIIYADPERASNNLKSYRQALLDAVFAMNVPPGLTEGGPGILLDQVTVLYSMAGFSYSVRRKDEANDQVCNDVDKVNKSINRVVDNIARDIARDFNMTEPEAFHEKLGAISQEFEANIYNARNGFPIKKRKIADIY